ncbi:MAG: carboxypeptidase regulatory-like domain-containing protein [Pyrinomonadaceae bacterium]
MKTSSTLSLRLSQMVITLLFLAGTAAAQSGRSWMNGFVFADSDTTGLPAATVVLVGAQNNERLRSVRLTKKTGQDGKYSIEPIPYGEYTFRVSANGYYSYQIKLYIGSDMLTQIHVKLRKKRN